MKSVSFATTNRWKYERAYDYFRRAAIEITFAELEIPESRNEDVRVVAQEKARYAYKKLKRPVFVLDAGFYIEALKGFPTTYVKFAEHYVGSEGILKLLEGKENRAWSFPHAVCFKDGKLEKTFVGTMYGTIANELAKNRENKFGRFNDIMIPEGYNRCFADLTQEELQNYDDRIWTPRVYDEFITWLKKYENKVKRNSNL